MNTALKIIIGILIVVGVAAAWMYFSGNHTVVPAEQNAMTDTNGSTASNGGSATVPPPSDSLNDLNAAVDADVSNTQSLSGGDDSATAAQSGDTSASNASNSLNGSY